MAKRYIESKTIERTDTLPITINADGNELLDYRIYGESGGVGDRTENLFDINKLWADGQDYISGTGETSRYIKLFVGNGAYTVSTNVPNNENPNIASVFISTNETTPTTSASNGVFLNRPRTVVVNNGYLLIYIRIDSAAGYLVFDADTFAPYYINAVEGSTAPASYIPYGYKMDMSVSDGTTSTTTSIYIGSDPLGEDEYVDYGEKKIYRMSGGVLTPTDPPVLLPEIPTVDGTTIIDYDGTPKPSQIHVKYNSWSGWESCAVKIARKSKNLFDENAKDPNKGYVEGKYLKNDGLVYTPTETFGWSISEYIPIESTSITISGLATTDSKSPAICLYDSNKTFLMGVAYDNNSERTVSNANAKYIRFSIDTQRNYLMLNEGSTALPYELYGTTIWEPCTEYVRRNGVWVQQA